MKLALLCTVLLASAMSATATAGDCDKLYEVARIQAYLESAADVGKTAWNVATSEGSDEARQYYQEANRLRNAALRLMRTGSQARTECTTSTKLEFAEKQAQKLNKKRPRSPSKILTGQALKGVSEIHKQSFQNLTKAFEAFDVHYGINYGSKTANTAPGSMWPKPKTGAKKMDWGEENPASNGYRPQKSNFSVTAEGRRKAAQVEQERLQRQFENFWEREYQSFRQKTVKIRTTLKTKAPATYQELEDFYHKSPPTRFSSGSSYSFSTSLSRKGDNCGRSKPVIRQTGPGAATC